MSARQIGLGDVLRVHFENAYTDIGKVVWLNKYTDTLWWIPFPRKANGNRAAYIKAPVQWRLSKANESLEETGHNRLSAISYKAPDEWSLSDEELQKRHSSARLTRKSRRDLTAWKRKRDDDFKIIEPIIMANDRYVLIETDQAPALAAIRAKELGVKPSRIIRLLRLYMMAWGERNCLLPAWANCGNAGTKKISAVKTGRPNKATKKDPSKAGLACQKSDHAAMAAGYKKYKVKMGLSVYKAYIRTMEEYYCESVVWLSPTKAEIVLLPKCERPTESEFKTHGPAGKREYAAARLNLGEIFHERNARGLTGSARDGIEAFGQSGWIDSTSEDQTPVSSSSKLKILPSTYRTMVMEGYTSYILGLHSGFEHSSVMTGLMALYHAASPKSGWCRHYGVEITEGEWHSFMLKRVRGDNGDLKGERGIQTLSQAQITFEIVRAFAAELKGPLEAGHKVIHRSTEHDNAGSTKGRQRKRGEPAPEAAACRTHYENMPHLIGAVLRHNNIDHVPELLTLEMRNDGVEPTRKAIFEWMIGMGYVVSEPIDLDHLRAQCLPRLKATIKANGIHLRDPRDERYFIPGLVYWCDWIHARGLTEKGRRKGIETEIFLNPSCLAEAWIYLGGGVHRLDLRTKDAHMHEVALCDWLSICDDDSLRAFVRQDGIESYDAGRIASNQAQNEISAKAKREEEAQQVVAIAPKSTTAGKRANAVQEKELEKLKRLGLTMVPTTSEPSAVREAVNEVLEDDLEDMLMQRIRAKRAA
jgi:hypothetical protein